MIEREIKAAEIHLQESNKYFQQVKAVHDQAEIELKKSEIDLQGALKNLSIVRAEVLLGRKPEKELTAIRKRILQLQHDVDELPGTIVHIAEEMEKARGESARKQQEFGNLEAARDYPKLRDEIVAASKYTGETLRAIGKLNVLAVQLGRVQIDEVHRLNIELREHSTGRNFKEPFTFTPDA